ncbi:hypothetical protein [Halanaeroarchaeum sulfurireducens]|uniref:PemK family protein n=1 Tax=Halanaeroarchaeum sulfurireducens TaxID=1604004 RepID=A0A0F7PFG3_9EURY|nr:hypothetical protein [Halanaeroarchaeum sulfurireducens]AKH98269.1 hypothetical protein HLASF_1798 [Halanaeroarchaeum sulfurireducens]ALG82663.1 hypothetical protein HLASA_1784 [Halanaeroarchaeum sulfurireducens]
MAGYERGDVVKGPDFFGASPFRPWVCIQSGAHPFDDQEGIFVAVTTTRRTEAIPLTNGDFKSGGLPKTSFVNPWTVTTIKHADIQSREGVIVENTIEAITQNLCDFVGFDG